ncbi:putative outer membrane starch-binding protein [Neolewinella xylanilytica]|uniref:Putative outer membrane starch-binding protein n=1 Tax=Neolewinella xylanilytica TaxID=1514080 RepID=A0A2S6I6I3_9BACT|nr:RagB/SusD family nutrient uptake outer membrane protein [Neolewinella xylanilytica]PPK87123.1 putative outer membrane starch-binding protein [Neolewinella xylanilytica]
MNKLPFYPKLLLLAALLAVSGCEKLDLIPENTFTDASYWTSTEKAQTFLNTAYSQLYSSNHFFYNEALSDNAYNGRGDNAGAASIASGTYDASLGRIQSEWDDRYAGIKTCNLFLQNVDRVPDMDEGLRERMKAEARYLRAWQHFILMTWFGDVPLLDSDPTIEEAQTLSRTPRSEVLAFVLEEFRAAADVLPTKEEYGEADRGRITQGAALATLARVHLYEGNWQEVVNYTERLMSGEAGNYDLFSSYSGLFLPQNEYSVEDILSIQYVPELRTWGEFFDMAPLSAGARLNALAPTQELVDSYRTLNGEPIGDPASGYDESDPYENRDPRLEATIVYHGYEWTDNSGTHTIYIEPGSDPDNPVDEYAPGSSASPTGYYTRKYFDPTYQSGLSSGLNLMLIRYADVLLMYAEAKMELGEFDQSVWDQTVRRLRERAGFTDALALNYDASQDLREVIRNERRVELAMEGLRIFDIRRWRIAEDVLNGWAHGARFGPTSVDDGYVRADLRTFDPTKHYLWPIPRDERLINDNLTQNPGW